MSKIIDIKGRWRTLKHDDTHPNKKGNKGLQIKNCSRKTQSTKNEKTSYRQEKHKQIIYSKEEAASTCVTNSQSLLKLLKTQLRGYGTCCSSRGTRFYYQHSNGGSKYQFSGEPCPLLVSVVTACMWCTNIHAGKTLIHIKIDLKFIFKKLQP